VSRRGMTVGALATRTGVSVRTLHHYEAIGLLTPEGRTEAGYRLYGDADVVRLQQIRSLRQLGFGLDQIGDLLNRRGLTPLQVVEMHLDQLRQHIAAQQHLSLRLEGIARRLREAVGVSVDDVLTTIEEMTRMERYYTPEQLADLQERAQQLREDGVRQAETDWQQLIAEVRTEMERGTNPTSERVRSLAARWQTLVQAFTGGHPEIARSLQRMWSNEDNPMGAHGTREQADEIRALGRYLFGETS
jgi:MerR family transcriptional regulator, thiopeptide resistance regulator